MYNFLFRVFKKIKKNEIIKKLSKITNNKVCSGYYKSTYLKTNFYSAQDVPSQLLGIYEYQVQEKIIHLQKKKKFKYIINFGSSHGYHVLGLIKNKFFKNGIAFEMNSKVRKMLIENVNKNHLDNKISIYKKANFEELQEIIPKKDLKKILFLVDIEGEEFNLFTKENLKYFIHNYLIIEDHEAYFHDKKKINNFYNLLNNNFKVEKLYQSSKNPFKIKELKDLNEDEKWLAMSECRLKLQNWLVCYPKNK